MTMATTILLAVILLLGHLSIASSQEVCRASVGTSREYKVGANSFHVPIMQYLTEIVGPDFDPPISFVRGTANLYMNSASVELSLKMGYDFMLAHPYASSCYESEAQAVPLATQILAQYDAHRDESFNLTRYGAVLYALQNRTDIQSVEDVKGKKIGSNKITNLATHLCYDVLLRSGVHHLQDPEQTIFFDNSKTALPALLEGKVDVGCAATATLEKYIDPTTGQPLDLKQIRILHPQNHTDDDGSPFPFAISSHLVPGYIFVAFPHVEQSVQMRVQNELLAMRDHADVAPSLLACIDQAQCAINNTACVDACFASLPAGTIRNCDTTARLALKAFDALKASGSVVGFSKPVQNLQLRDIQETTGFLVKDPPTPPRCVRLKKVADAVTCPEGHFVRSSLEIVQQCNVSGLQCYGWDCICSPCVKAYEVDFFASPVVERENFINAEQTGVGSGCSKFSICGTVQQEHLLRFRAIDNRGRQNASITGSLFREDESEELFAFDNVNGTFQYDFLASRRTVGQLVVKIRINNQEIPESPFRIKIVERDCVADTGDDRRVSDDLGQCVCQSGMVEISAKCVDLEGVNLAVLLPSILALFVFLCSILWCICRGRKEDPSVWILQKEEISFDKPPKVLGRGAFGVVLLGEFRGTKVAVKRVIAPREMSTAANEWSTMEDIEQRLGRPAEPSMTLNSLASTKDAADSGGRGRVAAAPRESTAPIRDGVTEMAARLNAAGMLLRTQGAADYSKFVSLQKHFFVEMRVLSQLRHPNVTTLMGAVLDDIEGPLLIMEYMDLGSLYDILHDDAMVLEEEKVNSILQDISQGMRFLHASDPPVIHGDLKARNILVDSRFRAKVADFGLSHSQKKTNKVVGSPFWMAPELLRHESANTTASDIYSFGVILYEVYSRKNPYEKEDPVLVLKDVADPSVNKRPPIPSTCPSQIRSLMEECFVRNPEQRPTFEEVDKRLKRVFVKTSNRAEMGDSLGLTKVSPSSASHNISALKDSLPENGHAASGPGSFFFSSLLWRLHDRKRGNRIPPSREVDH